MISGSTHPASTTDASIGLNSTEKIARGDETNRSDELTSVLETVDEENISAPFAESGVPGVTFHTPYDLCLRPFLEAMGWEGQDRQIAEALPHMDPISDLDTFRLVISRLGFDSGTLRLRLSEIGPDLLPAMVVFGDQEPAVLLSVESHEVALVFDPVAFDFREIALDSSQVTFCWAEQFNKQAQKHLEKTHSWFSNAVYELRGPLGEIFKITLFANIFALATPVYVMNVYNIVIGGNNIESLPFIFTAVLILVIFEFKLRQNRGVILAFFSARLSSGILNAGFSRILGLPINMIEAAPIGTQIIRLKQFEGIHSFFTGPVGVAILELPFILLFLAVITLISPALALIPLALASIFVLFALLVMPEVGRRNSDLNSAVSQSNAYLTDSISKVISVHQLCFEHRCVQRFIRISKNLALKRCRVQFFDSMLGVIAQSMMMLAGVSTMFIGASLVMNDTLSVGGLIAVMMLIWRVLAPIQIIFTNLNRISQFRESAKQIDVLMRLPLEHSTVSKVPVMRKFQGRVTLGGVAFRYGYQQEPVFKGLNIDIPSKQFVCISSATAGGRSTILKLILGLYRPQAGAIYIDGVNLLQLDSSEVRASIGYLPLEPELFYGTIVQNMRMAEPSVSDNDIVNALNDAGVDISCGMFPEGVQTRLTTERLSTLPIGTQQCLSLARLFCRKSSIYLLNDPASHLDEEGERALLRQLTKLKGSATIILVSSRPEHHQLADRVIRLSQGVISEDYDPCEKLKDATLS